MKSWQRLLGAVAIAAAGLAAAAAHAQRYAVISLIGDRMQIAYASGVEGQPVDRITRRYVALDDTTIDRAVLLAANDKLRELVPGSDPVLLQAFERTYFDIDAGTAGIIDWIRQLVRKEKGPRVTHAVIVTKMQYDGIPALQKPYVGSGTLEGVGFFVGRTVPPAGLDPNSAGPGFLQPFAYFEVTTVDLVSGKVLHREKGTASNAISAQGTDTGNPWDTLSGTQKVQTLVNLVRTEVTNVLPKVLKPS
jgi:hypothetical protein